MKKVVVFVSALMLFAGLSFAQTPQTKDQKPAEKKEAPKATAKPADKKETPKPTPAAKSTDKAAEKKAPEKK